MNNYINYWQNSGLSFRASNILVKEKIFDKATLINKFRTFEEVYSLYNCGYDTGCEIWNFISQLKNTMKGDFKNIPLINKRVSLMIWQKLSETDTNDIMWSVRLKNCIKSTGFLTLLEVSGLSPQEWLKVRNFGITILKELQDKISQFIDNMHSEIAEYVEEIPIDSTFDEVENILIQDDTKLLPLLKVEVDNKILEWLKETRIDHILWKTRTQHGLENSKCATLADIVMTPASEWLAYKHFGRGSLNELKEKILIQIQNFSIENYQPQDSSKVTSFSQLGDLILARFNERECQIIKLYYGYNDSCKTLNEIGNILHITRERVRQVKENTNKILQHYSLKMIIHKELPHIIDNDYSINYIKSKNGICWIEELIYYLSEKLNWSESDRFIIHWFDEVFGREWMFWELKDVEIKDDFCIFNQANLIQNTNNL